MLTNNGNLVHFLKSRKISVVFWEQDIILRNSNVLDFGPNTSSKLKLSWDNKCWKLQPDLLPVLQPCSWGIVSFQNFANAWGPDSSFRLSSPTLHFKKLWTCRFGLKWAHIGVLKSFWVIFFNNFMFNNPIKLRVFIDVTTRGDEQAVSEWC